MAKADTEQGVLDDITEHMASVHRVDAKGMISNIKMVIQTTRT